MVPGSLARLSPPVGCHTIDPMQHGGVGARKHLCLTECIEVIIGVSKFGIKDDEIRS